jgi:hypothetical protein
MAVWDGFPYGAVCSKDGVVVQPQLPLFRAAGSESYNCVLRDDVRPRDERASALQGIEPTTKDNPGLIGKYSGFDLDARSAQLGGTPITSGGGVHEGDDDAAHTRVDEDLPAGRGAAVMVAGFESDDRCGPGRQATCGGNCLGFGMGFALALVIPIGNEAAVNTEQNAADRRVRASRSEASG